MSKPDPPKRPLNAVFLYKQDHYAEYKKIHPTKKLTEITSELCAKFKTLSDKDKEKYEKAYEKGRADYEKVKCN